MDTEHGAVMQVISEMLWPAQVPCGALRLKVAQVHTRGGRRLHHRWGKAWVTPVDWVTWVTGAYCRLNLASTAYLVAVNCPLCRVLHIKQLVTVHASSTLLADEPHTEHVSVTCR